MWDVAQGEGANKKFKRWPLKERVGQSFLCWRTIAQRQERGEKSNSEMVSLLEWRMKINLER